MAKCPSCNQRKAQRPCPALGQSICSLCCGSKRQKEIACEPTCQYLQAGTQYQLAREVKSLVHTTFRSQDDDVFAIPEVAEYASHIERAFVEHLYPDQHIVDMEIHEALGRLYLLQTGKLASLEPRNRCEQVVFQAFADADAACPDLDEELKAKTVLRIMRSVEKATGRALGPRNYLEMIYSQFTGKGKWAHLYE